MWTEKNRREDVSQTQETMCIGNKAENSSPDALVNLLSNITSEITHIMENAV